jgi:hypothetical protein
MTQADDVSNGQEETAVRTGRGGVSADVVGF